MADYVYLGEFLADCPLCNRTCRFKNYGTVGLFSNKTTFIECQGCGSCLTPEELEDIRSSEAAADDGDEDSGDESES